MIQDRKISFVELYKSLCVDGNFSEERLYDYLAQNEYEVFINLDETDDNNNTYINNILEIFLSNLPKTIKGFTINENVHPTVSSKSSTDPNESVNRKSLSKEEQIHDKMKNVVKESTYKKSIWIDSNFSRILDVVRNEQLLYIGFIGHINKDNIQSVLDLIITSTLKKKPPHDANEYPKLRSLVIENNENISDDETFAKICKMVESFPNLKIISLKKCSLKDQHIEKLIEAISKSTSVQKLYLNDNLITDKSVSRLRELIDFRNMNYIRHQILHASSGISPRVMKYLVHTLTQNVPLAEIRICYLSREIDSYSTLIHEWRREIRARNYIKPAKNNRSLECLLEFNKNDGRFFIYCGLYENNELKPLKHPGYETTESKEEIAQIDSDQIGEFFKSIRPNNISNEFLSESEKSDLKEFISQKFSTPYPVYMINHDPSLGIQSFIDELKYLKKLHNYCSTLLFCGQYPFKTDKPRYICGYVSRDYILIIDPIREYKEFVTMFPLNHIEPGGGKIYFNKELFLLPQHYEYSWWKCLEIMRHIQTERIYLRNRPIDDNIEERHNKFKILTKKLSTTISKNPINLDPDGQLVYRDESTLSKAELNKFTSKSKAIGKEEIADLFENHCRKLIQTSNQTESEYFEIIDKNSIQLFGRMITLNIKFYEDFHLDESIFLPQLTLHASVNKAFFDEKFQDQSIKSISSIKNDQITYSETLSTISLDNNSAVNMESQEFKLLTKLQKEKQYEMEEYQQFLTSSRCCADQILPCIYEKNFNQYVIKALMGQGNMQEVFNNEIKTIRRSLIFKEFIKNCKLALKTKQKLNLDLDNDNNEVIQPVPEETEDNSKSANIVSPLMLERLSSTRSLPTITQPLNKIKKNPNSYRIIKTDAAYSDCDFYQYIKLIIQKTPSGFECFESSLNKFWVKQSNSSSSDENNRRESSYFAISPLIHLKIENKYESIKDFLNDDIHWPGDYKFTSTAGIMNELKQLLPIFKNDLIILLPFYKANNDVYNYYLLELKIYFVKNDQDEQLQIEITIHFSNDEKNKLSEENYALIQNHLIETVKNHFPDFKINFDRAKYVQKMSFIAKYKITFIEFILSHLRSHLQKDKIETLSFKETSDFFNEYKNLQILKKQLHNVLDYADDQMKKDFVERYTSATDDIASDTTKNINSLLSQFYSAHINLELFDEECQNLEKKLNTLGDLDKQLLWCSKKYEKHKIQFGVFDKNKKYQSDNFLKFLNSSYKDHKDLLNELFYACMLPKPYMLHYEEIKEALMQVFVSTETSIGLKYQNLLSAVIHISNGNFKHITAILECGANVNTFTEDKKSLVLENRYQSLLRAKRSGILTEDHIENFNATIHSTYTSINSQITKIQNYLKTHNRKDISGLTSQLIDYIYQIATSAYKYALNRFMIGERSSPEVLFKERIEVFVQMILGKESKEIQIYARLMYLIEQFTHHPKNEEDFVKNIVKYTKGQYGIINAVAEFINNFLNYEKSLKENEVVNLHQCISMMTDAVQSMGGTYIADKQLETTLQKDENETMKSELKTIGTAIKNERVEIVDRALMKDLCQKNEGEVRGQPNTPERKHYTARNLKNIETSGLIVRSSMNSLSGSITDMFNAHKQSIARQERLAQERKEEEERIRKQAEALRKKQEEEAKREEKNRQEQEKNRQEQEKNRQEQEKNRQVNEENNKKVQEFREREEKINEREATTRREREENAKKLAKIVVLTASSEATEQSAEVEIDVNQKKVTISLEMYNQFMVFMQNSTAQNKKETLSEKPNCSSK